MNNQMNRKLRRVDTSVNVSGYSDFENGTFLGQPDPYLNEHRDYRGHELPEPPDNEQLWSALPSDDFREKVAVRFDVGAALGQARNWAQRAATRKAGLGIIKRAAMRAHARQVEQDAENELRGEIIARARRRVR